MEIKVSILDTIKTLPTSPKWGFGGFLKIFKRKDPLSDTLMKALIKEELLKLSFLSQPSIKWQLIEMLEPVKGTKHTVKKYRKWKKIEIKTQFTFLGIKSKPYSHNYDFALLPKIGVSGGS